MKKFISILIVFMLVMLFSGCNKSFTPDGYIRKAIGISLPKNAAITYRDTHSGPFGDGEYFAAVKIPDEEVESFLKTIENKKWVPLPLRDDINALLYGGVVDEVEYLGELTETEIPKIETGYWYFHDRSEEKSKDLLNRYSYNFTIAMFDTDTNTLYVYELDT